MNDRFTDHDDETRDLVLHFEKTILGGTMQFFDVDELETIIDYYIDVDDHKPLEKAIEYAEQLYPTSVAVKIRRAHLLAISGKHSSAIDMLLRLRAQHPDDADIAYSLGILYGEIGESLKAIEWYQKADGDEWQLTHTYYNIAEEYYKLHDYSNAIEYYLKALQLDPLDASTLYNYTDTCLLASLHDEALQYIDIILDAHPYHKEAWHCKGIIHRSLRQYEKATDALEYAIAVDPHFEPAYIELAQTQAEQNLVPQAAATLTRLLPIASNQAHILSLLGQLYLDSGNIPTATQYLRQTLSLDPDDPANIALLALAYFAAGDTSLSVSFAKKSLSKGTSNPNALLALALSYDEMGKIELADKYFDDLISSPDITENHCQQYLIHLYDRAYYDTLIDFATDSLDIYPQHPIYATYLAAALFYTNRYNRLQHILPFTIPSLLVQICPELPQNPRLSHLIPNE